MISRSASLLLSAVAFALGLTSVFHADPVKAEWADWTPAEQQYNYVSEVVTLNADSLGPPGYCELFVGLQEGSGNYEVHVKAYPGGVYDLASASVEPPDDHTWLRFNLEVDHPDSFVKGRKYEFRFQRPGSRIHFCYDAFAGTKYDSMIVPV